MASSLPTRCSGAKVTLICIPLCLLRILSNDDEAKQQLYTYITLLNSFFWRPPHDYAVKKPPNATFYEGREHKTINFPYCCWAWIKSLGTHLKEKSLTFDKWEGCK